MTASRVNRGARRAGQEPPSKQPPPLPVDPGHVCYCARSTMPADHPIGQHPEFWLHPPVQGIR